MRAQHGIDAIRREARRRQLVEERILAIVPGRHVAALLVVAEPGVDDDPARGRLDKERMDRHFQPAFPGCKMRDEPGQFLYFLVGRERKDETGAADRLHFDGLRDPDLAHGPVHPALPLLMLAAKMLVSAAGRNGSSGAMERYGGCHMRSARCRN